MSEQNKKDLAETLWLEIKRAIINSSRVRDRLENLERQGMLEYLYEHDLLLEGKKLIEEVLEDPADKKKMQGKLKGAVELFLGQEDQSFPSIKTTVFPKGFFSVN
jgi:hypothetical protein